MKVGENIRMIREERNITKAELARSIDVSPAYITMIENGKKENLSTNVLVSISKALNVTVNDLISGNVTTNIGYTIKKLRRRKGMTQEELANKSNISVRTIANYESGKRKPNLEMIIKICNGLDIQLTSLDIPITNLIDDNVKTIKDFSTLELIKELETRQDWYLDREGFKVKVD